MYWAITPASVIKEAFSANLIDNGQVWMNALDLRNKISHTYNFETFEKIIIDIEKYYYPELEKIYLRMLEFEAKEG